MILKSFELVNFNIERSNFYLMYGENEGYKIETIKKIFEKNYSNNIYRYDEKEIIDNKEHFFNSIYSKSFFEDKKLIIISRCSEKIIEIINEIIEKDPKDTKIILTTKLLDKKSKLRSLFEKNKKAICIPFYTDNFQTLNNIVYNFFKQKKISMSQQSINLLVERCRGDRQNLFNELDKIESFIKDKKSINLNEILKLTNLAENYTVSELTDNCLAKNLKKTLNILNENKYTVEDCILIIRTFLIKSKRIHKLQNQIKENNNIDSVISLFKPPIFWKEKDIVKQQIKCWPKNEIEILIYKINEIELLIKNNTINSVNILSDFIINEAKN